MVVHENECFSCRNNDRSEDFPWMNPTLIDLPQRDEIVTYDTFSCVDNQHDECFLGFVIPV